MAVGSRRGSRPSVWETNERPRIPVWPSSLDHNLGRHWRGQRTRLDISGSQEVNIYRAKLGRNAVQGRANGAGSLKGPLRRGAGHPCGARTTSSGLEQKRQMLNCGSTRNLAHQQLDRHPAHRLDRLANGRQGWLRCRAPSTKSWTQIVEKMTGDAPGRPAWLGSDAPSAMRSLAHTNYSSAPHQ